MGDKARSKGDVGEVYSRRIELQKAHWSLDLRIRKVGIGVGVQLWDRVTPRSEKLIGEQNERDGDNSQEQRLLSTQSSEWEGHSSERKH